MSAVVDVFWSFRSPYSYLVTPDLLKLREDFAVTVKLRPVLPIALRSKELVFDDVRGQNKVSYILLDVVRRAEYLGMEISLPNPDPIVQNMDTFEVADEQPYIYRLTALGIEAEKRGKGIDLAHAISHLIWTGTPNWHQGDLLKDAVASVGLDLAEMEQAISTYNPMEDVASNQVLLEDSGHWGVPTMVIDGEPFYGQDRINTLRWRLQKLGLKR